MTQVRLRLPGPRYLNAGHRDGRCPSIWPPWCLVRADRGPVVAAHGVGVLQRDVVVVHDHSLAVPCDGAGPAVTGVQVGVGGEVSVVVPLEVDPIAVQGVVDRGGRAGPSIRWPTRPRPSSRMQEVPSSPLPLPARHSEHRCCILQGGTPKRRATTPATASARADFISACPPTVRRAAAGVVATTTPAVADLLAEVAGLLERAGDGEPDEPLNRQAAGLCRKARTDPEAIPVWIEEGRRHGAAAHATARRWPARRVNDTPGHPAPLVLIGESQPSRPVPGCTFVQDGRSVTTESAPLAAMTRPARTRDGHEPASGWRLRAPASPLPRLP